MKQIVFPSVPSSVYPPDSMLKYSEKWSYRDWALYWHTFGFNVIPILPAEKHSVVKWDPWLEGLDATKVNEYWTKHPDHEIGFIVSDDIIVFDADTEKSVAVINHLEKSMGVASTLIVSTKRGEHHYFRRKAGTIAHQNSHSSEKHPYRLDVKTGRAIVILPPSTGKSIKGISGDSKDTLSEVNQEFINVVFEGNGQPAPSASREHVHKSAEGGNADAELLNNLAVCLGYIEPDCGYEIWRSIGMGLHNETGGSDEGFDLFDEWSRKGKKYPGREKLEAKWKSFRSDVANPVTRATIYKYAQEGGADIADIFCGDHFEVIEEEVFIPDNMVSVNEEIPTSEKQESVKTVDKVPTRKNPMDRYSLRGMSSELEKQIMEARYVLDEIALMGEATVLYAQPNTGKTLLTLNLLVESIRHGRIDPDKVYYINVDDSLSGLHQKLLVSEEYGFHMLAEGHRKFRARELVQLMENMTETDKAHEVVIILDTLKKFVDLMNKKDCSLFSGVIRGFIMKGGTVIALAHTNKNRREGKLVAAGTSDILDDFDCAYIMDTFSDDKEVLKKVIEFANHKRRGNVASCVYYSYDTDVKETYVELLSSVEKVEEGDLLSLKRSVAALSDTEIISAVESCIAEGINTKMELIRHAAERAKVSRRNALKVIDRYTGNDPGTHRWDFTRKERGANVFVLLNRPTEPSPEPPMPAP